MLSQNLVELLREAISNPFDAGAKNIEAAVEEMEIAAETAGILHVNNYRGL
jgi:hypothetical protein